MRSSMEFFGNSHADVGGLSMDHRVFGNEYRFHTRHHATVKHDSFLEILEPSSPCVMRLWWDFWRGLRGWAVDLTAEPEMCQNLLFAVDQ